MTKTKGQRTQPAATVCLPKTLSALTDFDCQPIAEAVYAFVETHGGGTTHLNYMLTVPEPDKIDDVQKDLGIVAQASLVAQVRVRFSSLRISAISLSAFLKNSKFPAPPQAGVPNPAKFPER